MKISKVVEYVFFFGLLAIAGYLVWLIAAPFIGALALSAIIVTICYPLYEHVKSVMWRQNKTLASLATTLMVLVVVILPLVLMFSLVAREMISFYQGIQTSPNELSIQGSADIIEQRIQTFAPGFELDVKQQLQTLGGYIVTNIGKIFASTLSTLFLLLLSIFGTFYFFRDGKELMQLLIKVSPLPDHQDEIIFERMAKSVRAVATGTILLALIQGVLASVGFLIFGVPHALLWGTLASIGALMPSIGTALATVPAIIYLSVTGDTTMAIGLAVWSVLIVGFVDNLLGPYLIGRKNNMHPLIILIAVLGGINLFGPIGFIVGPVIVTLFFVLLEIYNHYIIHNKPVPHYGDQENL